MSTVFTWIWILTWSVGPIVLAIVHPETWRDDDAQPRAEVERRIEELEQKIESLVRDEGSTPAEGA